MLLLLTAILANHGEPWPAVVLRAMSGVVGSQRVDPPSAPMGKQAFMLLAPVAMKSTWKEQSAVAAATPAAAAAVAAGVEPEGLEVAASGEDARADELADADAPQVSVAA